MQISSYDLRLDVDFKRAVLSGDVTLHVQGSGRDLTLDAAAMEIKRVLVNGNLADFEHQKEAGRLVVHGVPQDAAVQVQYEKVVYDGSIFGIYKSMYGSDYILATDLEPAEARTVFPCKDDPSFKSVFKVQVTTDSGMDVISNMPLRSVSPAGNGRRTFSFHPTPKMSTYLLFLAIGLFDQMKARVGGVEVIVASRPGQRAKMKHALEYASKSLSYFQRYFGIPYPLKKLHLVGLPEYHTGAMENWGAIASREAYVLLDRDSSISERRNSAAVIAHEVAHQWFGDLVTMKWWNDLWLNESFATLMEYKAVDSFYPRWSIWDEFMRTSIVPSLFYDSLSDTHPVSVDVKTPEEAGQVFDAISYGKGASVLRMVESYLGEEKFRKGVSSYLRKYMYSNATGQDLWVSIEEASGKPISRIMAEWVTRAGFPVVTAKREGKRLLLSQSRFLMSGKEERGIWPIPLTVELGGKVKRVLFEGDSLVLPTGGASTYKVNSRQTGFYSVLYDNEGYDGLARRFGSLHKYDRWGILGDLFMFLAAGRVEPDLYFRFLSLCSREKDYLIVRGLVDQLSTLYSIAEESALLREAAKSFLSSQLSRLGLSRRKGETETETMLRGDVASLAVRLDGELAGRLAEMFDGYSSIDPNMRAAVARAYAIVNGDRAYDTLASMVKTLDNEGDRGKIYSALCSFTNPEPVRRALDLSISGEVSRSDSGYTISYASLNPYAREATWHWIRDNFWKLWDMYGGSQQLLLYFERAVPRCAVDHESEVREFLTPELMTKGGMVFRRTLELLQVYSRLRRTLNLGSRGKR